MLAEPGGDKTAILIAMNVVIDMMNIIIPMHGIRQRGRRSAGFTMAELLIVVAIIGVLAGVSFVAVQTHQKNVTQSQYNTIAKEIFIAAQNHLTLAKSENYGQKADLTAILNSKTPSGAFFFGPDANADADGDNVDIRYFYSGDTNAGTALDQILPFGAVELVSGGSFIIRYQPISARVLDVFYWTNGSDKFDANLSSSNYTGLVGSDDTIDKHRNYDGGRILGWFGGEQTVETGEYLEAPVIEVINEELLLVKVSDPNASKTALEPKLKLIVEGTNSGAKVAIPLVFPSSENRVKYDGTSGQYTVVLDDITTAGMHFKDLNTQTAYPSFVYLKKGDLPVQFDPGENLKIQAVAYSNTVLTSVAYSGEWTTNSLFAEVTEKESSSSTPVNKDYIADKVFISNIRHLENLGVSYLAYDSDYFDGEINAVQTADLIWDDHDVDTHNDFIEKANKYKGVAADAAINVYIAGDSKTEDNCFLQVYVGNNYTLTYDGQYEVMISEKTVVGNTEKTTTTKITENHSITGITVNATNESIATMISGGVFSDVTGATIKNLALIDTSITVASAGDAGALAGELTDCTVENVVAYNTTGATTANITAAVGDAGGLIGKVSGTGSSIKKCAAAVIVNNTGGNAGGLIGTMEGGTVTGCYSGGHTIADTLSGSNAVIYDDGEYNVTAAASEDGSSYAGGLIGNAGDAEIKYSYSTCSALGNYAGGFIGTGTGDVTSCYATGLVLGGTVTKETVTENGVESTKTTITEERDQEGAFAYSFSGSISNCNYFEIVNEREEKDGSGELTGGYDYLKALASGDNANIKALDESAAVFNEFSGSTWANAKPYNATLTAYYGEGSGDARVARYILKTVAQLGLTGVQAGGKTNASKEEGDTITQTITQTPSDFVATHYGDWPAPEIFVINTAS